MSDTESLVVCDLNNLTLRAHAGMAKAGLKTKGGVATGGLFGCIRIFNGYIQKLQPTHVACFWDFGKSSFRTAIQSDYKGDRPKSSYLEPGEVQNTFHLFEEYLNLIQVFHYKEQNVEADDLIANCVTDHQHELPITILSADHDLLQLVRVPSPFPVVVVKPSASSKSGELVHTYQSVVDKYKLPPERLAELWAIEGDSSDAVRGVPKYGPVRALKVLQEFGTLSNAVANHRGFAGYERLIHNNYRIIKLPSEVETVQHELEDYKFVNTCENEKLMSFFKRYELHSLVMKLDSGTLFRQSTGMRQGFGEV